MTKTRMLLLAGAVSATWLFANTMIDYDHSANFSKYHTYSWTAKGWQKVASGGDASIVAVGSTRTEQSFDTWYDGGFGGGWFHRGWWGGGPGLATATVERTPVRTLHVDIFDGQSKKVIWHGSSTDTLTGDPEKNEKKLEKAVTALFKKFPSPEKG
jgi:hypothetical protein